MYASLALLKNAKIKYISKFKYHHVMLLKFNVNINHKLLMLNNKSDKACTTGLHHMPSMT